MINALPPDEEFVITDPDQQPGVVLDVEPNRAASCADDMRITPSR